MRKKAKIILIGALSAAVLLAVAAGIFLWQFFRGQHLSFEEIYAITLQDAGFQKEEVANLSAKLDDDERGLCYEVSFRVGSTEYEYVLDAVTGAILQREKEESSAADGWVVNENLTAEQIEQIALDHANLQREQVDRLQLSPAYEDGVPVFEVEFISGDTEYDYVIHAITGKILSAEQEKVTG